MKSNKLAACIRLAHKVTVYVPGTVGAASLLSSRFGGATSSPAVGYWLSDVHGLIRENTTIVFAYAAEQALESGVDAVVDFCAEMRDALDQEAVALEIDGEMYFI